METKPFALVIEDNEDQNLVFTTALQQAGYAVESIFNGETARQRVAATIPDMVILDLHMPEVDGNVILGDIRADKRLHNTRVILATADAAFADSLQPQADLVLLKPISFSQLHQLVSRYKFRPKE
ncbi:MAG: response regulator [Chloroflexi bacterium]|nr:response regulator [Chloroflexota bacterium]